MVVLIRPVEEEVEIIQAWLDRHGIPREEAEVPWEQKQELPLSARILRLHRETSDHQYVRGTEMAEILHKQQLDTISRMKVFQCAEFILADQPEAAYRMIEHMGLTVGAFTNYLCDEDMKDREN